MKIVAVNPQKRIDGVLFPSAALYDHVMHIGIYSCPHCGSQLQFKTTDFERHFISERSNLKPEVRRAFDKFRTLNVQRWECLLDFNCCTCGAPVRIIYEVGED